MKILKEVIKYAEIIFVWFGIIAVGIAIGIVLGRSRQKNSDRVDGDIRKLRKSNRAIKNSIVKARENIDRIADRIDEAKRNNQSAMGIVQGLEATNRRFRQILEKLQNESGNN